MRPVKARLLGLLLAAASGCAGSVGAECEFDTECAEELTCFAGICQELGTPEGEITFEVIPHPGTGLQPTTFAMGDQPLRLDLCAPAGVSGSVDGEAEVLAVGVPAGLQGQTRRVQQQVAGDFFLPLPPGSWELTFLLDADDGGELPPPERIAVELSRCETEAIGAVAPAGDLLHARFDVLIDPVRDPRPRCGVLAQIHDPLTGEPLSRALRIEREQGRACGAPAEGWTLPFHPPATGSEIELRLSPASLPWPTFAEKAIRFALPPSPQVDLGAVGIGAEAILERVEFLVVAPDGGGVEGARIRAIGRSADGTERFAPPFATDLGGGRYEIWLVPSTYEVRIEPPPGIDAAIARCIGSADGCVETLVVEPGVPTMHVVALERPLKLEGRVLTADREPLPGARVVALPLGDGRRVDGQSGPGGRYELALDPGSYELVVQPAPAWGAWRRYVMTEPLLADGFRDLQLPAAARVVGTAISTVEGKAGPLHRAMVRAWRVEEGAAPKLLGESLTDPAGRFGLELPAEAL